MHYLKQIQNFTIRNVFLGTAHGKYDPLLIITFKFAVHEFYCLFICKIWRLSVCLRQLFHVTETRKLVANIGIETQNINVYLHIRCTIIVFLFTENV